MARVLLYLAVIALTVYALIDCIQTDESKVRGIPKIGWIVLIVLITVVGPVAWILAGKERKSAGTRGGLGRQQPPRRAVAPDDDPDFLRQLGTGSSDADRQLEKWEEERRRREEGLREDEGDGDPSPGKG